MHIGCGGARDVVDNDATTEPPASRSRISASPEDSPSSDSILSVPLPVPPDSAIEPDAGQMQIDDDLLEALSPLPDLPSGLDPSTAADIAGTHEVPSRPTARESIDARAVARLRVRRTQSSGTPPEPGAIGTPERWFARLSVQPLPWVQAGGIAEKDPGESAKHAFTSAFIRFGRPAGGISVIIGDYRIQAGSGILLGRASFSAVGARLFHGRRTEAAPLKPHTSADENRFFRGLAARLPLRLGDWAVDATAFASSVKRSGRIDDTGAFSPYTAGLFRTTSELGRLGTNRERLGGAIVALRAAAVTIECAGLWTGLANPIVVEAREAATCRSWTAGSVGFGVAGTGFEISGEVAYARSAALTFEARTTPARQVTAIVRFQSVRPGFLAPYGTGASGSSSSGNMRDCLLECLVRPARWANVALAASLSSSPGPLVNDPAPSTRSRLSAEAELLLAPGWTLLVVAGDATAVGGVTMADPEGRALRVMREDERSTLRVQSSVNAGEEWSLRNRCELVWARRAMQGVRELGALLQTDLRFRAGRDVRASFRASLFDVNGWGARVYAAEEDVEGSMRLPVFTGRGVRLYALLRWSVVPAATLSCRYGVTFRETSPRVWPLESDVAQREQDISLQLDIAW